MYFFLFLLVQTMYISERVFYRDFMLLVVCISSLAYGISLIAIVQQNRLLNQMAGQCHGNKRKKSSTKTCLKVLKPGDLARATRKLVIANETRRKKLGLAPSVEPTSPIVQETPAVVQPASPAVLLTPPTVLLAPPVVIPISRPVVLPSQATAPLSAQSIISPSLEEEVHVQGLQGDNLENETEDNQDDDIIKTVIRPLGRGYFIFVSFTIYHALTFINKNLFLLQLFCFYFL